MDDLIVDVYERERDGIIKRLSRSLPNVADAEDIVQSAVLSALKYKDTYNKEKDITVWFNGIVNNEAKAWRRANKLQGMTTVLDEKNGGLYDFKGGERRLSNTILGEISRLKDLKKNVIYRRFVMEMGVNDIAAILEVGRERVKKVLLRWRQDMKNKYGEGVV